MTRLFQDVKAAAPHSAVRFHSIHTPAVQLTLFARRRAQRPSFRLSTRMMLQFQGAKTAVRLFLIHSRTIQGAIKTLTVRRHVLSNKDTILQIQVF